MRSRGRKRNGSPLGYAFRVRHDDGTNGAIVTDATMLKLLIDAGADIEAEWRSAGCYHPSWASPPAFRWFTSAPASISSRANSTSLATTATTSGLPAPPIDADSFWQRQQIVKPFDFVSELFTGAVETGLRHIVIMRADYNRDGHIGPSLTSRGMPLSVSYGRF